MRPITIRLSAQEKAAYRKHLEKHQERIIKEAKTQGSVFFTQAAEDLKDIIAAFPGTAQGESAFERRAIKYVDMLESYRLAKYQYGKYSDRQRSLSEGVYASIALAATKHLIGKEKPLIADIGSGTSRFTYELIDTFPEARFELYDFSITNLHLARKLLSSGETCRIPARSCKDTGADTELLSIPGKTSDNIQFTVCDLEQCIPYRSEAYDLINATHSVNLLARPDEVVADLADHLKPGGLLLVSDLLGWKEDRPLEKRSWPNGRAFAETFNKLDGTSTCWQGGPYIEEHNDERQDHYVCHFAAFKKR
jgi:SAM-dependent methyltransferase